MCCIVNLKRCPVLIFYPNDLVELSNVVVCTHCSRNVKKSYKEIQSPFSSVLDTERIDEFIGYSATNADKNNFIFKSHEGTE